jgi:hypothetical protein
MMVEDTARIAVLPKPKGFADGAGEPVMETSVHRSITRAGPAVVEVPPMASRFRFSRWIRPWFMTHVMNPPDGSATARMSFITKVIGSPGFDDRRMLHATTAEELERLRIVLGTVQLPSGAKDATFELRMPAEKR